LPILFPFFFFQCKPTKGLYQHIYSKPNTKSCQRSSLVVSGWIEGRKRSPRPNPAEPSPLSPFFNQPLPSTPSSRSPPCRNPSTSPTSQRHGVSTPRRPCCRHAHRGRSTGAEQHRPPLVMSPRRRAPLRAHDQFPRAPPPRTHTTPRTGHATPSRFRRPEHPDRTLRSRARAHAHVQYHARPCTATSA
jgi:hypothetical protein